VAAGLFLFSETTKAGDRIRPTAQAIEADTGKPAGKGDAKPGLRAFGGARHGRGGVQPALVQRRKPFSRSNGSA
jgi:hypothetical protein